MSQSSSIPGTARPRTSSQAGRWYLAVIGLALALVGSLFVWLMARSFLRAQAMRHWPEVACAIITSEIEERVHDSQSAPEYRYAVSFGYEWQGQARTGDHLTLRGSPWTSKRESVDALTAEFPSGKQITCRVDPANPDFALLKPDSLAPGYSIWFPALFVVGGLGITIRAALVSKC